MSLQGNRFSAAAAGRVRGDSYSSPDTQRIHQGVLPMPDTMADRRIAPRYPVVLIAHVSDLNGERRFSARTSDLSRTGCYVDTLTPMPKGACVRIKLIRLEQVFEATATVMYVSRGLGMGIRFEEPIPSRQVALLETWLERAASQAE